MKRPFDQLIDIAQKAVNIGNEVIRHTRPQIITEKSDRDTSTDVDIEIERNIRAYLAETTPEINFIGEEEGAGNQAVESECFWTLDPIDGTANFVHGVPLCGVSLALMKNNQAIVASIVLPYLNLKYTAAHTYGAYVNGQSIKVSKTVELSKAMIAIGDYALGKEAETKNRERIALTATLASKVERIRMFGSAAHDLAWLAEGRIDGAVILSNKTHDVAAGVLIVREAGGIVLDSSGEQHTSASAHTIAAAPEVAAHLLDLVQSALQLT